MSSKLHIFALTALLLFSLFGFSSDGEMDKLRVLVLHAPNATSYLDAYQNFNQSLIATLDVQSQSIDQLKKTDLPRYALVYLDPSVKELLPPHVDALTEYVENGGSLFVENELGEIFPRKLIGAERFLALIPEPDKLDFPKVRPDLQGMQDVVRGFFDLYKQYADAAEHKAEGMGLGAVPTTATSLVQAGKVSLLTVNQVGKGHVLFASGLVPNHRYVTGFDLLAKGAETQKHFDFAAATANYLLRNEAAAFVAKQRDGFVLKKVLGTNGRPAMAHQDHFEVTSAIRDGSMQKWIDMLKEYQQIPSYTLARAPYEWATWKESVIYHLNRGTNERPIFQGEEENSQYSSGRQAMVGNDHLLLQTYPAQKYLSEPIELPYRAYPYMADVDGDGQNDMLVGSGDGQIFFYKGSGEMLFGGGQRIASAGTYAAPLLYDFDRDGQRDLIVGTGEGEVKLFRGQGKGRFAEQGQVLLQAGPNAAPDIGDVDGDGVDDLVVGEADGKVYFYQGTGFTHRTALADVEVGRFAAPRLYDYNGDGRKDLLVGNDKGFLHIFVNRGGAKFGDGGYLHGETRNPFGNSYLWSGHNAVPVVADLNGDGKQDLVVGQLEHASPLPIDAPGFPYREQLQQAIDYAKANHVPIQPHLFFHSYKSAEQEKKEIALHRRAFEQYGLPWRNIGTNQHTWRTNNLDPGQTLLSEYQYGIRWNSGFRPGGHEVYPAGGSEYGWAVPFFLATGEKTEDMVLFTPAPVVPDHEDAYQMLARFDLPLTYFEHVEYQVHQEHGEKNLRYMAAFLDKFRDQHDYNFMTEDQMMESFRRVLRAKVRVGYSSVEKVWDSVRGEAGAEGVAFYVEVDEKAIGLKLEPGEKLAGARFATDADVYMRSGNALYFGVGGKAKVYLSDDRNAVDAPHIMRVNVPVEVNQSGEGQVKVEMKGSGLQQIKFFAPHGLDVLSKGWDVQQEGEAYVLTRYGGETILDVKVGA